MVVSILQKAIALIISLGILVFVHELGHYLFARMLGVKVIRFCIGFGKPLAIYTSKKTGIEYAIACIPLGGYVKMLDSREVDVDPEQMPYEFNSQPIWKRFLIVFAGPFFNYVFAIIVFWMVFLGGELSFRPIIGEVIPETIASSSGIQSGDEVLQIADNKIVTLTNLQLELMTAGLQAKIVPMVVKRGVGEVELMVDMTNFDPAEHIGSFAKDFGIKPLANNPAIISSISGKPAFAAGLQDGDKILAIDSNEVLNWNDMAQQINKSTELTIKVDYKRGNNLLSVEIKPEIENENGSTRRIIGVRPYSAAIVDHTIVTAFGRGIEEAYNSTVLILKGVWSIVSGTASVKNLSGPIQIANTVGKFVEYGIVQLARLLALLSISLGILNLLPIPVLDGGHLFFYIVEAVRGRPLEEKVQEKFQTVGLAILVMVMTLAFYVDLQRVFN